MISASASALFLLAIAAMNIVIFISIYNTYRRVRAGGADLFAHWQLGMTGTFA